MKFSIIKMLNTVTKGIENLRLTIAERVENFGAQYKAFGIFGVLNFPIFYLIWRRYNSHSYESFFLRLTATCLCFLLLFEKNWPKKLQPWLPIYWYFTLLFCLPFFFFYMLFKNPGANVWLMSSNTIIFWLVLLVDWFSYVILIGLGLLLAILGYILTTPTIIIDPSQWWGIAAQFVGSFVVVVFFARNKSRFDKEKLQTIKTIGASIAHELRTPLRTITSVASSIKDYFPKLLQSYQLAKKDNLPVPYINPIHYETLLTSCDLIESETEEAFTIINMLLMNVSESINSKDFTKCSIHCCVDQALRRYPFDKGEAELVHWRDEKDFNFNANELLIIHVLFNLLKNALYQIKAVHKGKIEIWASAAGKYNTLHFKDTAKGISKKLLPNIFNRFYTRTYHGTGIGLAFCKIVMENLGGRIICEAVEGEYAEFILYFPKSNEID